MPAFDEAELIQRAQDGDRAAFAAIHDQHRQAIYTYIYYRVGDRDKADELTADVFVRMVEKIDKFHYRGKPILAWLYTIARNLVADYHRNQGGAPDEESLDENLTTGQGNPAATVERNLLAECLHLALRYLTEVQRQVIIGKFLEGRTNEEMAGILDKTSGAIKSLQHRALAALRRAIEKEQCYEL